MATGRNTVMTTKSYTNLTDKELDKFFFDGFKRHRVLYSEPLNVVGSKEPYLKEGYGVGLGAFQETQEGGAFPYDSYVDGDTKTAYFTEFKLGLNFTQVAKEDDQIGIMSKAAAELGKAAAYTKELEAWDILNNGFVTTYRTGVDGLALFDTSHPYLYPSGSTFSNETTSALSRTSLNAARVVFRKMRNERYIPIDTEPKLLIIPPDLEDTAKELLLSEFKPGSADNDINTLYNSGISYLVVPYLSSTTAWFLLASKDMHDLRFINRAELSTKSYDDPNTGNTVYAARMRFMADFWMWQGTYGSTGA